MLIRNVGVIGCGQMDGEIAAVCACSGYPDILLEPTVTSFSPDIFSPFGTNIIPPVLCGTVTPRDPSEQTIISSVPADSNSHTQPVEKIHTYT